MRGGTSESHWQKGDNVTDERQERLLQDIVEAETEEQLELAEAKLATYRRVTE